MRIRGTLAGFAAIVWLQAGSAQAQFAQPNGGNVERGTLPGHWLSQGPKCMEIPDWQVHEYNANFYILRQSPCTDYEKPFIFLLFGRDRAMLVDTGSRGGDLVPTLQSTLHKWLARNGHTSIPLLVVHTHEHGDHVWGDHSILAMNDPAVPVTLIPAQLEATRKFYGIATWPTDLGQVDLGQRQIDLIPIPGHSAVSVAFYDRNTGVLLTGDTLYPGRLYVSDFPAFQASVERLIHFTEGKPVAHLLGNHIEQSRTPFLDYPVGTMYQPEEHVLAMARGELLELQNALAAMQGKPKRIALRDFSVWPSGAGSQNAAEAVEYTKRVQDEKARMWDHTKP